MEAHQSHDLDIEMKGYVDSSALGSIISESEALILPTLLYEGFPMTIVEAFSLGIPVICSDLGNSGSIIDDGVTGWKFKPGSAEELAEAVRKCMNSRKDMRESIRRAYEEQYTPDANYRRLNEIYLAAQKH